MNAQASGAPRRVSMNPATFQQGGLIDDVDVEVVDARWCLYDYQGKSDNGAALTLGVQFKLEDGKVIDQYYSAGDKEYFRPSTQEEDGQAGGGGFLVPLKEREAMSSSTNAAMFLNSLIAAGFPVQVLDQHTITAALVTMKAHINQVAQPKRQGLIKRGAPGAGPEREKTTALISRIITFPAVTGIANAAPAMAAAGLGSKTPTPINAATKTPVPAAAPVAVAGAVDAELDNLCNDTLINLLAENGGELQKAKLPAMAFKALSTHPRKKEAVPRIFADDFLSSAKGITFDGAVVKLA